MYCEGWLTVLCCDENSPGRQEVLGGECWFMLRPHYWRLWLRLRLRLWLTSFYFMTVLPFFAPVRRQKPRVSLKAHLLYLGKPVRVTTPARDATPLGI